MKPLYLLLLPLLASAALGLDGSEHRWTSHLRSAARITEVNADDLDNDLSPRSKREAVEETPVSDLANAFHLNNSHLHLMVHWVGKGSPAMFCLARDQVMKPGATSQVRFAFSSPHDSRK